MTVNIKISKDKNTQSKTDAPCSQCKRSTKHIILTDIDLEGREETENFLIYGWDESYQTLQCLGCESLVFRKTHMNSEDEIHWQGQDGYESEWRITENYYPNPAVGRQPITDTHLIPQSLRDIYEETVATLNSNQRILSGIGLRAIVETVCKDKNAQGRNLDEKITNLIALGVLTAEGAEILHKIRVLGNKAAHEVVPHDSIQLSVALDVVDNLLMSVYIIPHHARKKLK